MICRVHSDFTIIFRLLNKYILETNSPSLDFADSRFWICLSVYPESLAVVAVIDLCFFMYCI